MNRSIYYDESKILEEGDKGLDCPLYKINLYDKIFLISIGKENKLVSAEKKQYYYFPIYLMNEYKVHSQIGVFEYESNVENQTDRLKPYLDSQGDVDLNLLGDPILYGYANDEYFENLKINISPSILSEMEKKYIEKMQEGDREEDGQDGLQVENFKEYQELEPFELDEKNIQISKSIAHSEKVLQKGIFEMDKTFKRPVMLQEETKELAKAAKQEYKEHKNITWIEKFMKNNHYDIVQTQNNGDCLFDSVRLAYEQIGYKTTVQKLRAIIAKEVDDELFRNYRELYQGFLVEKTHLEKEMRRMVATNKELKKRLENIPATEKENRKLVTTEANAIVQQHKDIKEKYAENNHLLEEFQFMKDVTDLEKLREVIQTSIYWADNSSISILEKELNMKFIILSELNYDEDDLNNVLQCTSSMKDVNDFSPDFYIFVTYSGNHYRLISYKSKRIFKFSEIPYYIKTLVVIKCMEKNAGIFHQIQDFRNFKSKLGVYDENEDDGDEMVGGGSDEVRELHKLNLDTSTVLCFYNKSNSVSKVGKGAGETIRPEKEYEYSDLNLKKHKDWRKKLDDDWGTIFTLDNLKWNSVEHYYQASKFKKHNPEFYKLFSVGQSFEKDVELAKSAGSQTGKYGNKQLRPSEIKVDPDFYGNRQHDERERALVAKFSQNEDLKQILELTKNAVLKKYIPKSKPKADYLLMKNR